MTDNIGERVARVETLLSVVDKRGERIEADLAEIKKLVERGRGSILTIGFLATAAGYLGTWINKAIHP